VFEKRFTAARMAHHYVAVFQGLIKKGEDQIWEAA
jgi:hypothetical protein